MEGLRQKIARTMPEGPDTKEVLARVEEISVTLLYPIKKEEREDARAKLLEALTTMSPEERAKTARAVSAIVETLEKSPYRNVGFNGSLIRRQLADIGPVAEALNASNQE